MRGLLAAVLLFTVGCASIPGGTDPTVKAAAKITAQYVTLKLIGDSERRAERVIRIVDMGIQLADSDPASVYVLRDQILALIPPDAQLDAADRLLIANLAELLVVELERRVGQDPRLPVADVKEVLGWVKEAAVLAGPMPEV